MIIFFWRSQEYIRKVKNKYEKNYKEYEKNYKENAGQKSSTSL